MLRQRFASPALCLWDVPWVAGRCRGVDGAQPSPQKDTLPVAVLWPNALISPRTAGSSGEVAEGAVTVWGQGWGSGGSS